MEGSASLNFDDKAINHLNDGHESPSDTVHWLACRNGPDKEPIATGHMFAGFACDGAV